MNEREIDITITAYQKSVIESGAPPEEWVDRTKKAIVNHSQIKQWIMAAKKENA